MIHPSARGVSGILLLASALMWPAAWGQVESIQYDRQRQAIEFRFGCPLRLLSHDPLPQSGTLQIRLLPSAACRQSEQGPPPSLSEAGDSLVGVRYDREGAEFLLTLQFIEGGRFQVTQGSDLKTVQVSRSATVLTRTTPTVTLDPQAASGKLAAARSALTDGDYERAQRELLAVLSSSARAQHPEALEYLALAYQLDAKPDLAEERYRLWLARFGAADSTHRHRIQQRLDALTAAAPARPTATPRQDDRRWHFDGAIGQDIWAATAEGDFAGEAFDLGQSTLAMTYVDASAEYRGDIAARVVTSLGYRNAFGDTQTDSEPFARLAYLELDAGRYRGRLGRQRHYGDGILGMFDGARVSRALTERLDLNLTLGLPVDSPRYASDTAGPFLSLSLDSAQLYGFDSNVYMIAQQSGGIWDRQAIGGYLRRAGDRWHVVARTDFDLSYNALNTALIELGYRPHERVSAHLRINAYAFPYVGTQNALQGQLTSSLDELLNDYRDEQLRTIARNRTTDALEISGGLHLRLGERWNASLSSGYTQMDETVASAGVDARPATDQITTSVNLLGSSILRPSDALQLRYDLYSDQRLDTHRLNFDWRFALGDHVRLRPRIGITQRLSEVYGDQRSAIAALKLSYLFRRHFEVSAEVIGGRNDTDLARNDPFWRPDQSLTDVEDTLTFILQWRAEL